MSLPLALELFSKNISRRTAMHPIHVHLHLSCLEHKPQNAHVKHNMEARASCCHPLTLWAVDTVWGSQRDHVSTALHDARLCEHEHRPLSVNEDSSRGQLLCFPLLFDFGDTANE